MDIARQMTIELREALNRLNDILERGHDEGLRLNLEFEPHIERVSDREYVAKHPLTFHGSFD